MTNPERLTIHYNDSNGPRLALTLAVGRDGHAAFTPGEDPRLSSVLMGLVGSGAPARRPPYVVRPTDGAAYLGAVADLLGRTSRWLVTVD